MPEQPIYVEGRRVYIRTGGVSQTVNICTESNRQGEYENVYRLRSIRIERWQVVQRRTLVDLCGWLNDLGASPEGPRSAAFAGPTPMPSTGQTAEDMHVGIGYVVDDSQLAVVLEGRLEEAHICDRNGAYASAIIVLGSFLEGVLLDAVKTRLPSSTKALDKWNLNDLIETAHKEGWINADVHGFAGKLREYRNLVHPNAQVKIGHAPDRDTLRMCWPVVNAALNDLVRTRADTGRCNGQVA